MGKDLMEVRCSLHRGRIQTYGHIAQVWSSYETPIGAGTAERTMRRVNTIQRVQMGDTWRIATILWESDRSGGDLPPELMQPPRAQ